MSIDPLRPIQPSNVKDRDQTKRKNIETAPQLTLRQSLKILKGSEQELKIKKIKILFDDEKNVLSRVSGMIGALTRWEGRENTPEEIFNKGQKLEEIPLWEQAHFLAHIFKNPTHIDPKVIADFIILNPTILKQIDYWMLSPDFSENSIYLNELLTYLNALNPNDLLDLKRFKALQTFSESLGILNKIAESSENFWMKAFDYHLKCSDRNIATFCDIVLRSFNSPFPTIERINLDSKDMQKILSNEDLKAILSKAHRISFPETIDEKTLGDFLSFTTSIKSLDLSNFTTLNFESLKDLFIHLTYLEELNLSYTQITDEVLLRILREAKNLRILDLSNCNEITLEFANRLTNDFDHLEVLKIFNSRLVTVAGLELFLMKAKSIKELYLFGCTLVESISQPFKLDNLKILDLGLGAKDPFLISFLPRCLNLKTLNLIYYKDDLSSLNTLTCKFDFLETIDLNESDANDRGLLELLKRSKNISELNLNRNSINLESLSNLPNPLNQLRKVDLAFTWTLDKGLTLLLNSQNKITYLNLAGCGISFHSLENIFMDYIEELDLSFTNIDDINLLNLLKKTKKLEYLNLTDCDDLQLEFLLDPSIHLDNLETLNVKGINLNEIILFNILQKYKSLKSIVFSNSGEMTQEFIDSLHKSFPDMNLVIENDDTD